ncbi:MAG TPA: hypothetical protein VHD87_12770 [Acidimicrobiales bacterium]|nr:hypothetical protein [Acidimicrobiales bacterium]
MDEAGALVAAWSTPHAAPTREIGRRHGPVGVGLLQVSEVTGVGGASELHVGGALIEPCEYGVRIEVQRIEGAVRVTPDRRSDTGAMPAQHERLVLARDGIDEHLGQQEASPVQEHVDVRVPLEARGVGVGSDEAECGAWPGRESVIGQLHVR